MTYKLGVILTSSALIIYAIFRRFSRLYDYMCRITKIMWLNDVADVEGWNILG